MNEKTKYIDIEFVDYHNVSDKEINSFAYHIAKFDLDYYNDFPYALEILSKSHYKGIKAYKIRVFDLKGEQN